MKKPDPTAAAAFTGIEKNREEVKRLYYPDEIIDEVRSRSDIVDVVSANVKLSRKGSSYFGLCPFHSEKTPSFSVSPSKQIFYCFGCGAGGNVISYVMQYENYTFQEAVKYLADRAGISLPQQEMTQEDRRSADLRAALLEINKQAAAFYYYQLRAPQGKQGMDYLTGRGLSEETMHSFGLGYAGKYSDSLYKYLKAKGYSDDLLRESGLETFDERRGMSDKFWNRVMFPIMDLNSRVIGFGGRVMGDAKPKYLNSPETRIFDKSRNLYGLHVARKTRRKYLILCEGYMDVIAMHQAGFTNAVASLGTALTSQHCTLLKRFTNEVILSYDSDGAGVKAALRAIPLLRDAGVSTRVLRLRPYKDPDEFIKAEGAQAFEKRLEQAENSFFFELSVLEQNYRMSDPQERTAFLIETAKRIARFELEVERENYISAVASEYHVSYDGMRSMVLRELMKGAPQSSKPVMDEEVYPAEVPVRRNRAGNKTDDGLHRSQSLLLSWLTEYPGLYAAMKKYIGPEDFDGEIYQNIAGILYAQLEQGKPDPAAVISRFEAEEQQKEAAAVLSMKIPVENETQLVKAMRETIRKVVQASLSAGKDGLEQTDPAALIKILERKRALQEIDKLQISLKAAN